MHKLLVLGLLLAGVSAFGQDKKALDSVDKVIIESIIKPAEDAAGSGGPDWIALRTRIVASYTDVQTDRAITKAKIFYYWYKDWAKFSSALVHFTDAYENKDDLVLLNKNAKVVLEHSQDAGDYKAALGWMQHAVDKSPDNTDYKATRDSLQAKVTGH